MLRYMRLIGKLAFFLVLRPDEPQDIYPNRGVCAISGNTPAWLFGSVAQWYGGQVPRIALTLVDVTVWDTRHTEYGPPQR